MKKITSLLLFLFLSFNCYSQLALEGFENTTGPDASPLTSWTLGAGNWATFDNIGNDNLFPVRWGITNTVSTPVSVYQGTNAASVNRENVNAGNTSEEYLATPPVFIPANGVLNFYTRMLTSGNQGTIYQIKVSPANEEQTDPNPYILIQQWTEDQLIVPTTNFNIYTEKTVDLSAFAGQFVYVSFVKVYTQIGGSIGGDRWFIDNVSIDSACLSPTAVTASSPTPTSISLTWTNPNGPVNGWEIEAVLATGTATGVANYTTSSFPYIVTGLLPNTAYKFYVRALCTNGISSPWSSVSNTVLTQIAPPICGGNLVDSGGIGSNYSNNENTSITVNPSTPGDLVTVTFTAFNTQAGSDILRIYDGTNTTFPLLATLSGTTIPPSYTATSVSGSLTFAFTSDATTNASGYAANITCGPPPSCRIPTSLTNNTVTTTTTVLNWIQPTNPDLSVASAWQVLALPCGSVPPTAGATGFVSANSNPFTLTGLTPATCYDIYVRAVCSGPTSSGWSTLPTRINTLLAPPACGGNFVDSGGLAANYPNNANETTTISPVTTGDVVTITFTSFNTQAGLDILRIYDGPNNTFPLLATLSGTTLPTSYTASSATGALTFVFTSNGTTGAAGWASNIACGPPPTCRKPITFNSGSVLSTSAVLNWIQPANPDTSVATSWHVLALPCGSAVPTVNSTGFVTASTNPYTITGLLPLTCYAVYIRAACSLTSTSIWEGPISFTTQVAPPACGGNFVDVGGTTASYPPNSNSTITICPVNVGNVVTVTFTAFDTEATWDGLYVFDGNSILSPQIPSANPAGNVPGGLAGSYWGDLTGNLPGPFTSTSPNGCLTFNFRSDNSANSAGWIANVSCAPPPTCIAPTAITTTAGSITSSSVILNWAQPINPDGSTATAWQVLALPCGSPLPTATATGFVNASTNPFTLTGLNSITCYDIYIRAVCSPNDSSTWRVIKNITTQVAPPVCGGNFVDVGGPNADYANNSDSTVPICPVNPGDVVTVTFTSFNTEATWDGLYVFDGNSILSPQIPSANPAGNVPGGLAGSYWGDLTGNLPGPFTSTSNDGCLTFRFRSDGFGFRAGWVANVVCSPGPNCLKPTLLTSTNITATSASLGWTESNSAVTQWEIIYLPFGQPVPLPTATGVLVTSNPVVISGLLPGTRYTFYVRAICPTSGTSSWSDGSSFTTLIINDSCSGAIFTPVNSTLTCNQVVTGTITSATASTPAPTAPCVGTADDDVWFQFIATNTYLNISLLNVQGQNNLNFGVYSGLCGTLTQVFCSANNSLSGVANGLVLGQTYYVRVYSNASTPQTSSFNLCISTPSTCSNANTICNLLGENTPSTTGVSSLGTIGCLFSSPNPTFYTLEVGTSGPINLFLSQNALQNGQGVGRDIDYAAWGPFNSQVEACNVVGNQAPYAAPGIGVPVTQTTGCSFSAAATETLNITNAQAGQVYIILITNFSQQPGFINLVQTNIGQAGAGTVNCCPEAFFSYSPSTYCQAPGNPNPSPIVAPGSLSGVFSSPFTPGLVFANSTTGEINLLASAPGNYVIVNTLAATASCDERQRTYTINISQPTSATISYNSVTYCESDTTVQQVTQTGTTGGSYSAIPNVGLSINPTTGEINPSLSSPAVYSVVYGLPGSICTIGNPSTQVEIIDAPVPTFTQVAPICPGAALADLPTSSNDTPPITGTWSPVINNTATTTYTFTPTAGQCAETTTMTINVGSTTPTFNAVAPICPGAPLTTLPTTSLNGIGGFWTPALDNTQTTTYTFTPTSGVCVGSTTLTIEVLLPTIVPTFNVVPPICPNGTISPLPTISLNGITGVWSPALDNTQTTTYTFTPVTGQCGLTTTLQITVNPPLVVTVNNPTFCAGSSATMVATPSIPGTYTYTWTVPAGVPDPGNVASFTTTTPGTYTVVINQVSNFCNTDFETPVIPATANPSLINESLVPCWDTTASDGVIEMWPPGFEGVTAYSGNQLIELNANLVGTLFQDFIVIPGTTISVSFAHRGRQGNDVVGVEIGPVGGPYVSLGNFTDGNTAWVLHTVNYTIPTGSGNNYTLRFVSVSSAGGSPSIGNLLDSISISSLSCTSAPASGIATSISVTPVTGFNYSSPICQNAQPTISPTLNTGFTTGGTFSSTTGLTINASTGVINLATSTPGNYTITYVSNANAATCLVAGTNTASISISAEVTPVTGFNYSSPICQNAQPTISPTLNTGFTTGGTFSSTTGLTINASTGEIDLAGSTPGNYTITYVSNANAATCLVAGTYTANIVIEDCAIPIIPKGVSVNGDGFNDFLVLSNVAKLTIFNRLGMKVYSRNNYTDEWGGQSDNGDELPDGTYYYSIDFNGGQNRTGWIYLSRAQ